MPKSNKRKAKLSKQTQKPLPDQLADDDNVEPQSSGPPKKARIVQKMKLLDQDEEFIEPALAKKIIKQAKNQLLEDSKEMSPQQRDSSDRLFQEEESDENQSGSDSELDDDGVDEIVEISAEDERALNEFMSSGASVQKTLADIVQEKLTDKRTEIQSCLSDTTSAELRDMDPRVMEMYDQVKTVLQKYRSGKIPKAFKVVPALCNWEQILFHLEPDTWSAAAIFQATRIFASNLNSKMAQRFFNLVLLPRIRDDIAQYKRLNFHLYQGGDCTLREAIIISSVLGKQSVPMLESAAATLKLAEMDYSGANSVFLRTLIDKKYALPYRVTDSLVHHFLRFMMDSRQLPVLWHQCLLTFVQRYKQDISSEQKEALFDLLKKQSHHLITPEIRELISTDELIKMITSS